MPIIKVAFLALYLGLLVVPCSAAPVVQIRLLGVNPAGNREWALELSPDPGLFTGNPPAGSLAVELALAVELSSVLDTTVNAAAWPLELPGNNPFTGLVSEGLWSQSTPAEVKLFVAFGSEELLNGSPVELLRIETQGAINAKLRWGHAASGNPTDGALVAQALDIFVGLGGETGLSPDLNVDGVVDIFDVNIISDHWGAAGPSGDANFDGAVDIFDVNVVSDHWGAGAGSYIPVPEPTMMALALIVACLTGIIACRYNGRFLRA